MIGKLICWIRGGHTYVNRFVIREYRDMKWYGNEVFCPYCKRVW